VCIISHPGNQSYSLTDLELEIGVNILQANDDLKRRYIKGHISKYSRIYDNLQGSNLHQNWKLAEDYRGKITRLEEMLGANQG